MAISVTREREIRELVENRRKSVFGPDPFFEATVDLLSQLDQERAMTHDMLDEMEAHIQRIEKNLNLMLIARGIDPGRSF